MDQNYGYIKSFLEYRKSQNKFDYFFLGIILGLLSLSIQTFKYTKETNSVYLIIMTWVLLLIGFISGFFRQERINMLMRVETDRLSFSSQKDVFQKAKDGEILLNLSPEEMWNPEDISNQLSKLEKINALSDDFIDVYKKHSQTAYNIQKWSFFLSLITFALFKITNIFYLSLINELIIIIVFVISTFLIVKIYKRSLPKSKSN